MLIAKTLATGVLALGLFAGAASANPASPSLYAANTAGAPASILQIDHRGHWDRLSPREVRRMLRHHGYRQIEFLDRSGRNYTVRAENHRGRDFILRVSARSGEIISARRIGGRGGHGHGGHGGGWDGPGHGGHGGDYQCWLPEGCY